MSERDLRRIEVLGEVRTVRRIVAAAAAVLARREGGGGADLIHKARARRRTAA